MQRPLGGGHCHLALAAHHLEPLADRLLSLAIERSEVVDVARESAGLGGMVQRQPGARKRFQRSDAAAAFDQPGPEILE